MNAQQFRLLLQDLAQIAGMPDPSGLLEHGRVRIGEVDAVLVHDASYDDKLLQLRLRLGSLPPQSEALARAILEANYVSGWAGECVFSLLPGSDDLVITMRVSLQDHLSAQELWQSISDVARNGTRMWEEVLASAHTPVAATPLEQRPQYGVRA